MCEAIGYELAITKTKTIVIPLPLNMSEFTKLRRINVYPYIIIMTDYRINSGYFVPFDRYRQIFNNEENFLDYVFVRSMKFNGHVFKIWRRKV